MQAAALVLMLATTAPDQGPLDALGTYRQREQLLAAYEFSGQARLAVAEYWVMHGKPLPDASASDLLEPDMLANPDKGVQRIEIRNGTIIITLGGDEHESLAGQVLAVSLCHDAEQRFMSAFACGQAICPPSARAVPGAEPAFTLTTLDNKVLPATCRGYGRNYLDGMQNAERGDPQAQAEWATVLWDGQAVPQDRGRALELARASAAGGNAFGMWVMGTFHFRGEPELLPADRVQAYAWYLRSAALDHPWGIKARDEARAMLTPEERERGEALARQGE